MINYFENRTGQSRMPINQNDLQQPDPTPKWIQEALKRKGEFFHIPGRTDDESRYKLIGVNEEGELEFEQWWKSYDGSWFKDENLAFPYTIGQEDWEAAVPHSQQYPEQPQEQREEPQKRLEETRERSRFSGRPYRDGTDDLEIFRELKRMAKEGSYMRGIDELTPAIKTVGQGTNHDGSTYPITIDRTHALKGVKDNIRVLQANRDQFTDEEYEMLMRMNMNAPNLRDDKAKSYKGNFLNRGNARFATPIPKKRN